MYDMDVFVNQFSPCVGVFTIPSCKNQMGIANLRGLAAGKMLQQGSEYRKLYAASIN